MSKPTQTNINEFTSEPMTSSIATPTFLEPVARELVGQKQKSHESPTMENWRQYFVGYDANLKMQAWEGLQPTLPMMIPGEMTEVPALPASVEE